MLVRMHPPAPVTPSTPRRSHAVALDLLLPDNCSTTSTARCWRRLDRHRSTFCPERGFEETTETREIGSLNTAFMVSDMLIAPNIGLVGGFGGLLVLVGLGVVLWTLASGVSPDWQRPLECCWSRAACRHW